jgi:hypothetical protein
MKKISLLIVMALMVCKADTLSVNHDTVWQKIMVKDTSVSMQMKYVPIVVQKIEQTKPKTKVLLTKISPSKLLGKAKKS